MPELPEVETVRQILKEQIIGKVIKSVDVYYESILENTNKVTFSKTLIDQKINDILRYGKYLIFVLDNCSLISHLRMEGKYFYQFLQGC